jgi:hypothetical protein
MSNTTITTAPTTTGAKGSRWDAIYELASGWDTVNALG